MDVEAHLLDLMSRVRALEAGVHITDGIIATMIGITHDVTQLRNEIREDLAALGDEVAALRRHIAAQSASLHTQPLWTPGSPSPETTT
ncbi:hypothetical protein [Nonomuraea sp. NPDC050691]|uniref:hypothetical protein n=1 Tax=Nonomuraea sp. NPDC050691 TaxID=3155661 RepID=UPI0033D0E579